MNVVKHADGLEFDQDETLREQVGDVFARDDVSVIDFDGMLLDNFQSRLTQLLGQRVLFSRKP